MEGAVRAGELGLEDNSQGQDLPVHSWRRDTMKAANGSVQLPLL